jgi:hypothetical protein
MRTIGNVEQREVTRGGSRAVRLWAATAVGMVVAFGAGYGIAHAVRGNTSSGEPVSAAALPTGQATALPERASGLPTGPPATGLPTGVLPSAGTGSSAVVAAILPKVSKAAKPPVAAFKCPKKATANVKTASALTSALKKVRPGAVIHLADGSYSGQFEADTPGTAKKPIYLCGGRKAVLDGGGVKKGYGLHLNGASYWRVNGFTVQDSQKGVVLDGTGHTALQGLLVQQVGDEGVHLRRGSSNNVVRGLTVRRTGLHSSKYGEGIYIGTAQSNWCSVNACKPDPSNNDYILNNTVSATSSESVDIKEGTSNGVVAGNRFDGAGMTGADSWVDVKGNGWLIAGNHGAHAPQDGYQEHQIVAGDGQKNLFSGNVSASSGPGYAIHVTKTQLGNVVLCSNKATGAGEGMSNLKCSK